MIKTRTKDTKIEREREEETYVDWMNLGIYKFESKRPKQILGILI